MFDVDGLVSMVDTRLRAADEALARDYPGERVGWQPVHTVYVPADRFTAQTCREYGDVALGLLDQHADLFRDVTGADDRIVDLVRTKLRDQPIENVRVDFEDGYGVRPESEERLDLRRSARALWTLMEFEGSLRGGGVRIRSLEPVTRRRAVETLVHFLADFADADVPDGFVVTLPKVTSVPQVEVMAEILAEVEHSFSFTEQSLRFEIQVETPQSILGPDGTALVARMIHAAQGRCTGLHYGTYDYSAFLGLAAGDQSLDHPAADHAKAVMQAAAAGTGVRVSDGSTNVLPVGDNLRSGWELHHRLVTRALHRGFYQGWDLHAAQLPTRFAATFQFFRAGADEAVQRLAAYVDRRTDSVADEPASARTLADYLLRGLECGALADDEVGLDRGRLESMAGRRRARGTD